MSKTVPNELIQEYNNFAVTHNLRSVNVSEHFQKLVDEEIANIGPGGPLYRICYPLPQRTTTRAPSEVPDFVEDFRHMPEGLQDIAVRRYRNRVLFFPTFFCAGHCQYCFRSVVLSQEVKKFHTLPRQEERIKLLIEFLLHHPEIDEVILSGGDPITLPAAQLDTILGRLKSEAHVKNLRIHTKAIVYKPELFSDNLIKVLGQYRVRLYSHIAHPYEVAKATERVIQSLQASDVKMYNQFPVLRGINDHEKVLALLLERLDTLGIRQTSMFIADPIDYSATFRIPLQRLFSVIDRLNWSTASWINTYRLVLDTPIGKVRRENIVRWDKNTGRVVFEREGQHVFYHDLPAHLDEPGDIKKLLWK